MNNEKRGFAFIMVVGVILIMGIVSTFASKKINKTGFIAVEEKVNKTNIEYIKEAYNYLIEQGNNPIVSAYTLNKDELKGRIYSEFGLITDNSIIVSDELNLLNKDDLKATGLIIEDDILILIDKQTEDIYILEK